MSCPWYQSINIFQHVRSDWWKSFREDREREGERVSTSQVTDFCFSPAGSNGARFRPRESGLMGVGVRSEGWFQLGKRHQMRVGLHVLGNSIFTRVFVDSALFGTTTHMKVDS